MSLDLDDRQRAMLREIGVRVWAPRSEPVEVIPTAINSVAAHARSTGAAATNDTADLVVAELTNPPSASGSAAATLDAAALGQAISTCQACGLCSGRRAAVFDAGRAAQQCDWMVVGEPPDEFEEYDCQPFADQSGVLLGNMLAALGLSRTGAGQQGAYLTNVVKCRPAQSRNPQPAELAQCEHYLRREVALVAPKVILALGRFAAQALLRESLPEAVGVPLGKLRQQVYRYQGIPVLVSYHPGYLLRNPVDKAKAWVDLCLAANTLESGAS